MHGKRANVPLEADDIIFIPSCRLKTAINPGALLIALGTVALYRIP